MADAAQPVARELARFAAGLRFDELPSAVVHETRRSLLNWAGCAIGGSTHPAVPKALEATAPFAGPREARILGRREKTDIGHAALVNGLSAHVLDFDDTHLRTLLHPGVAVASALFALSEKAVIGGRDFTVAFVAGVEIACRVANAVYFAHNLHWYITGTAGVFGAAAAVGRALGLDEQRLVWALGLAAAQSAGTREQAGTMAKAFIHGRAAQNGLIAAFLAERGFTSADTALEGRHGFINVLAPDRDPAALTAGLGSQFELALNTYKPYACGVVAHPAIEACIVLRDEYGARAEDIVELALELHPKALELTGIREPQSGLKSKWSVYHSAAVAIVDGLAGEHQYTDERVRDPLVSALRARITARGDPALRDVEARARAVLRDGRTVSHHVPCVIGSAERPMSDSDLEKKARMMADGILPESAMTELVRCCREFHRLNDVRELLAASVP